QGGAPTRKPKVLQLVTYASQPIQLDRTCHAPLATHHSPLATIPFRITFFAPPHHLTLIESHSCKKQGRGWGGASHLSIPPNHFRIFPQRVNIQRAATSATPFLSCPYFTLSMKHGVGGRCHSAVTPCEWGSHLLFIARLSRDESWLSSSWRHRLRSTGRHGTPATSYPRVSANAACPGLVGASPRYLCSFLFTTHYPLTTVSQRTSTLPPRIYGIIPPHRGSTRIPLRKR